MRYLKPLTALFGAIIVSAGVATPSFAASPIGHKHITAKLISNNRISVDWDATSGAKYYKVRTSSTPDMSQDVTTYKVGKSRTDLSLDATSSRYSYAKPTSGNYVFVRVYAIKSNGKVGESPYKAIRLMPPAPAPGAQQVTVATFNVRTAESNLPGHSWPSRRGAVASRIRQSGASVVAIQEAGAPSDDYRVLISQKGGRKSKSRDYNWQFEQLRDAVGGPYQLANDQEYSRGSGKEGTRILFDSSRFTILDSGHFAPSAVDKYLRFVPWALFANKATGEQFYFISAHLDNRKDAGSSRRMYDLRVKQISTIIDKARAFGASGKQVVLAGDFNSNIYSAPTNGVHRKLVAAGFRDAYATANNQNEFRVTYNGFAASKESASRTDYIMTFGRPDLGGSIAYKNWTAKQNGMHPSDHNLQSATLAY